VRALRKPQKAGYEWKERYERGGVEALVDRSRTPHSHPHAVAAEVAQLLVAARRKHPTWGLPVQTGYIGDHQTGTKATRHWTKRSLALALRRYRSFCQASCSCGSHRCDESCCFAARGAALARSEDSAFAQDEGVANRNEAFGPDAVVRAGDGGFVARQRGVQALQERGAASV